MAKITKKQHQQKKEELFLKMVLQINKSISFAFTVQQMYNVHNQWLRRIEREYRHDIEKSLTLDGLHFMWREKFDQVQRLEIGQGILSSVKLQEENH